MDVLEAPIPDCTGLPIIQTRTSFEGGITVKERYCVVDRQRVGIIEMKESGETEYYFYGVYDQVSEDATISGVGALLATDLRVNEQIYVGKIEEFALVGFGASKDKDINAFMFSYHFGNPNSKVAMMGHTVRGHGQRDVWADRSANFHYKQTETWENTVN